jgi:hypothetical protein
MEARGGTGIIRAAAAGEAPIGRTQQPTRSDVATRRLVEQKLRELIKRLKEADGQVHSSLAESLPEPRTIQIVIPDLEATYWTEMSGGVMGRLHSGPPGSADIRIRCSSDHLVEMVDGKRSLFSSYLAGQLKIDASFTDMLRLRKLA